MNDYTSFLDELKQQDRLLWFSSMALEKVFGDEVHPVAEEILGYISKRYGDRAVSMYSERVQGLIRLQRDFEKSGHYAAATIADVPAMDRETYNLALLLSFITNLHRFRILRALKEFLQTENSSQGKLLAVGVGTGYEIKLAQEGLPGWEIEAYDMSAAAIATSRDLLTYFGLSDKPLTHGYFPLTEQTAPDKVRGRYDKIVFCELLEHLENPEQALRIAGECLAPEGRVFATMAINIAQEDHVFLYTSPEQCRQQVRRAGLTILEEEVIPVQALPGQGEVAEEDFRMGNYLCVCGVES